MSSTDHVRPVASIEWTLTREGYAERDVHGGLLHTDTHALSDGNVAIAQQTPGPDGQVYTLHRIVDEYGHTLAHRYEQTWNGGGYWMMHAYARVTADNLDARWTVAVTV